MGAPLVLTIAPPDLDSLVLVLAASSVAALLARMHRTVVLPTVVVEIVLGIVIGPEVLGWASIDAYVLFLENLGLVGIGTDRGAITCEVGCRRSSIGAGTLLSVLARSRSWRFGSSGGGPERHTWCLHEEY